jgi:hypothetical protein
VILRSQARFKDALALFQEALTLQRELVWEVPTTGNTEVVLTLQFLGETFLALGEQESGRAAIMESFQLDRIEAKLAGEPSHSPALPEGFPGWYKASSLSADAYVGTTESMTRIVANYFSLNPLAYCQQMSTFVATYLKAVRSSGCKPDRQLLYQIAQTAEKALVDQLASGP